MPPPRPQAVTWRIPRTPRLTGPRRSGNDGQVRFGVLCWCGICAAGWLAGQASRGPDSEIQEHLAAARDAEQARDYARAASEYQKILRVRPNLATIHQSLGLIFHLRNRFSEAIPEFSRAVQLDGTLWGSFLFLGIDYYKTNQFEEALRALNRAVLLNPSQAEPEARFWLGASHAASGRPEDAIREYRRAQTLHPRDIEVLYQLAKSYDQEASALFQRIGRINPGAAAVWLLEAEHLLGENRLDLAGIDYRRAVVLRPDFGGAIPALDSGANVPEEAMVTEADARATYELAMYRRSHSRGVGAAELLDRLARLKPADEGARQYVTAAQQTAGAGEVAAGNQGAWPALFEARRFADNNRFPEAEETLRGVLEKEPNNLDALLTLGRMYKRWAEDVLAKMIEIDPDSYRVRQLAGERQEEKGEYGRAVQSYNAALAGQPDAAGLRYAIGNAYWKMGKYDAAEHWLKEELERNPNHGLAHYRLGSLYTEAGKADEAITNLQEALKSHPELTEARFDLGRAMLLKGRYGDSIAVLRKVAVEDPRNDRAHYFLSKAYGKLGRNGQAQAEMAKYQDLSRKRLARVQQDVRDVSRALEGKP